MWYRCLWQSVLLQWVLIFIFGENNQCLCIIVFCPTALGFGKVFLPSKISVLSLQKCAGSVSVWESCRFILLSDSSQYIHVKWYQTSPAFSSNELECFNILFSDVTENKIKKHTPKLQRQ